MKGATIDELAAAGTSVGIQYSELEHLITRMNELGLLVKVQRCEGPSESRYSRQESFFSLFEASESTGKDFQRRLQSGSILIVGLGGYGSILAMLLARVGVKRLIAVDPDVVEESNLSRQVLFSSDDLGSKKCSAAHRAIRTYSPELEFRGYDKEIKSCDDLLPMLVDVDLVINSWGYLGEPMTAITRACVIADVPCLTFGGSAIGPLFVPGRSGCLCCALLDDQIRLGLQSSQLAMASRFIDHLPSFAPRMSIGASIASWEACRFLSGSTESPLIDTIMTIDTLHYSHHRRLSFRQSPSCHVCGIKR